MSRKPAPKPIKANKGPKKQVGNPAVKCAKNKGASKKAPCDFDRVTLKCTHNPAEDDDSYSQRKKGALIWRHKAWYRHDAGPQRGGASMPTLVFELVAIKQSKGFYDLIRIVVGGGPGYHCAHGHPHVLVTNTRQNKVNTHKGTTHVVAQGWRAGLPPNKVKKALMIISESVRPNINEYKVHVFACGVRPSGYPVRSLYAIVRVYPSDRYKINISVPAAKKKSGAAGGGSQIHGAKDWKTKGFLGDHYKARSHESSTPRKGGALKREYLGTQSRDGMTRTAEYSRVRTDRQGRQRTASSSHTVDLRQPLAQQYSHGTERERIDVPRPDSAAAWIHFWVNSYAVDTGGAVGKFLQDIVRCKEQYFAIKQFIKDFQPQIGWKFTWDTEILAGELNAEWGWKEDIDNEVYLWWKISGELTVLSAVAELSFGIEIMGTEIKVFGSIAGALKYDKTLEGVGKREDSSVESVGGISGTITGKVGVRAVLMADWVKAEAAIVVSLTPRFQVRFWRKFQVVCRTGWSGMKADMEISSKAFGYRKKQSYEIIPGNPKISELIWPSP
jgi:hypothetical protein